MLRPPQLGHRVPLRHGVERHPVRNARLELWRDAEPQQPVEHGVLLVRHDDLGKRQDTIGGAAHREERLLLPAVE